MIFIPGISVVAQRISKRVRDSLDHDSVEVQNQPGAK